MLTAGGRATGVRLAGGEVPAGSVILNADAAAVAAGLLGRPVQRAVPAPAGQRSLSAVTWAMQAEAVDCPLARHTVFFSRDYQAEFDRIARGTLPGEPTTYICAQDRDAAGSGTNGPERLLLLVNAPATGDTRPFPPSEIAACADRMFTLLQRCGAASRPTAAPVVTAPEGFNRLFPGTGGALYGQATHGPMASFARPGSRTSIPGLYLAGGSAHPGAGVPMAALSGRLAASRVMADLGSTAPVPRGGYAWWYVDALSEDGTHGLTIIAFIGSVFSPFYAWSRRRGAGDPQQHCALNVALYGRPKGWAMTERGRRGAVPGRDPTADRPEPGALGRRMPDHRHRRGHRPLARPASAAPCACTRRRSPGACSTLDAAGRHRWSPIAPVSRVEVALTSPALRWSGPGYLDSNWGARPLEADFVHWDWCRAPMPDGAAILYNATRREGGEQSLALRVSAAGAVEPFAPPPRVALKPTLWRVPRATRADAGQAVTVRQTLEDAPFYSRSVIDTHLLGQRVTAVHESLSMDRFTLPVGAGDAAVPDSVAVVRVGYRLSPPQRLNPVVER